MTKDKKGDSSPLSQPDEAMINETPETSDTLRKRQQSTTVSVADSIARIRMKLDKERVAKPSITLDISGADTPITFTNRREIIIGRADPNSEQRPDIDVSGLPINYSSISRKHLRFIFSTDSWYAEDMGSRNGSWLNGKLLLPHQRYPVRNGDQFQVGTVRLSVTYRDDPTPIPSPSHTMPISNQSAANQLVLQTTDVNPQQLGLAPGYISEVLMPYLSKIMTMMKTLDQAKKRSIREISITSISLKQSSIVVEFNIEHEVLQFLQNSSAIMNTPVTDETTQAIDPQLLQPDADLTQQFIEQQLPLVPSEQQAHYKQEFERLLEVIFNYNFKVAD